MAGAVGGTIAALGLTLALIGLGVRLLRRLHGQGAGAGTVPVAVLGRVALGPRQGLVVVRVGSRLVALSVGEGGVRPVLELTEADVEDPARYIEAGRVVRRDAFRDRLARALRTTVVGTLLLAPCVAGGAGELWAQAAPAGVVAGPAAQASAGAPVDPLPQLDLRLGDDDGGLRLTGTVGAVVVLGLLTLLPTLLLLMTGFTRILVVLHFLRQALGTQTAPPGHLIAALALLLTGFVMAPTLAEVNRVALEPWQAGAMVESEMLKAAAVPFREFMLEQTPDRDLATFLELGGVAQPETADDVPLVVLVSAFAISELRSAFKIGFALFLPFVVIDLVVSSVLMSMGMFMLPPVMISLPCKLLLFVLVDGWTLVVQGLVSSFA